MLCRLFLLLFLLPGCIAIPQGWQLTDVYTFPEAPPEDPWVAEYAAFTFRRAAAMQDHLYFTMYTSDYGSAIWAVGHDQEAPRFVWKPPVAPGEDGDGTSFDPRAMARVLYPIEPSKAQDDGSSSSSSSYLVVQHENADGDQVHALRFGTDNDETGSTEDPSVTVLKPSHLVFPSIRTFVAGDIIFMYIESWANGGLDTLYELYAVSTRDEIGGPTLIQSWDQADNKPDLFNFSPMYSPSLDRVFFVVPDSGHPIVDQPLYQNELWTVHLESLQVSWFKDIPLRPSSDHGMLFLPDKNYAVMVLYDDVDIDMYSPKILSTSLSDDDGNSDNEWYDLLPNLQLDATSEGIEAIVGFEDEVLCFYVYNWVNQTVEFFLSDGTTTGTRNVGTMDGVDNVRFMVVGQNHLYLLMNRDLWVMDRSGVLTKILENFQFHKSFRQVGDLVFFSAFDQTDVTSSQSGYELYYSDGTPEKTQMVQDIYRPSGLIDGVVDGVEVKSQEGTSTSHPYGWGEPPYSDMNYQRMYFGVLETDTVEALFFLAYNGTDVNNYKLYKENEDPPTNPPTSPPTTSQSQALSVNGLWLGIVVASVMFAEM